MISYWDFQDEGMQVTKRTPLFFASRGHRIVFMVHSETTEAPSPKAVNHLMLQVLRFNLPFKWMNQISFIRRFRQFMLFAWCCILGAWKIYRNGRKPDVIYAAEADAVLIGTILRRIYRVPLVTRFYGISRIQAHFDFTTMKLKPMGVKHYFSKLALTRRADMVIVTDDGSQGLEIIKALNPYIKRIKSWRNGTDAPNFLPKDIARARSSFKIRSDQFVLMTLCRLDRWKGVDLAIRALNFIPDNILKNLKLLVVGHGSELIALKKLVNANHLDENVIFAGGVPHRDIYTCYHLADIFLSLYRYSNVGNPLWEALNSGCCIITLNTGATGEIIQDGLNGRLLAYSLDEKNLIKNIAGAVCELYSKPILRKKLQNGAIKYSQKNIWSWEKRLSEEVKAIEEVVQQSSK